MIRHTSRIALGAIVVGILSACTTPAATPAVSGGGGGASAAAPTVVASATPASLTMGGASPAPGQLDACALFTAQDASQITGVTFGAGSKHTIPPAVSLCVYNDLVAHVGVTFTVAQGVDPATAAAAFTSAQAGIANASITQVSGLGTKAIIARATAQGLGVGAILVLNGATFFSIEVTGSAASIPGDDVFKGTASQMLGRLG